MVFMAIQFQCAGCGQPIEIDDVWAGKTVACPYCRRTITAPLTSTLTDVGRIPTASPLSVVGTAAVPYAPMAFKAENSNPLARTAFVLSCVMLGCWVSTWAVAAAHPTELAEVGRQVQESGSGAVIQSFLRSGQPPGWMVAIGLLEMGGLLTGMASLVCAVLALRRPVRRLPAVLALIACGVVMFVMVAGLLMAAAVIGPRT